MAQKIVLKNEIVKVKGRVKAVTVKKEDFDKFLKLVKLRILDKEYEALMPPLNDMLKNTIDIGGLAQQIQYYLSTMLIGGGSTNSVTPAQMVLTTSSGSTITLSYTGNIAPNNIGVTMYMQLYQDNNTYTFQYYYIGFDTTSDSYSISRIDLYVSQMIYYQYHSSYPQYNIVVYTPLTRIAYANIGISKSSSEYLFIAWLIEFENIQPYLMFFMPVFQNNLNIYVYSPFYTNVYSPSYVTVYFNNGSCQFNCGGNCPSLGLNVFLTYIQNNNIIVQFPLQINLGKGLTNVEILLCDQITYNNFPTISGSISATITPPVTGATYYSVILTITITYTTS